MTIDTHIRSIVSIPSLEVRKWELRVERWKWKTNGTAFFRITDPTDPVWDENSRWGVEYGKVD